MRTTVTIRYVHYKELSHATTLNTYKKCNSDIKCNEYLLAHYDMIITQFCNLRAAKTTLINTVLGGLDPR